MSAERRVCEAIEDRADELVELACELISFDTTTRGEPDGPPGDEQALQELLAERLRAAGFEVELWEPKPGFLDHSQRQVPGGLGFAGRPQLIARWRAGEGSSLLFNGHIDVVSGEPRELWTSDPFAPEIRDGLLFGRGACDMKGGVAAMIVAAEALAQSGADGVGELVVNTVTDEEWNGAGALAVATRGIGADAGIVTEASGFEAWVGCRGVLNPTVTVQGRPGHSELPQADWREGGAVNAIEKAMIVLDAVRELRERWRADHDHPLLAPGELIPTVIEGGEWWVSYPASCTTVIDVTYVPDQGDADGRWGSGLEREIEEWIRSRAGEDPWLAEHPPSVTWGTNLPPAEIDPEHPVVAAALAGGAAVGRPGKAAAFQGWHDAATFTRCGTPTISYGPTGLSTEGETIAHAIDEHVPVADLVPCAQALAVGALRFWNAEA